MTARDEIDTAAVRALADHADATTGEVNLDPDTVRALCDAYDDSEGLVAQSRRVSELELEKRTRLRAALDAAQAGAEREHALAEQRKDLLLLLGDHVDAVVVGEFGIKLALVEARAEKAEAQVAAVLALCDPQTRVPDAPWGFVSNAQVRAAVDAAS